MAPALSRLKKNANPKGWKNSLLLALSAQQANKPWPDNSPQLSCYLEQACFL
jgi:hypothetical protein